MVTQRTNQAPASRQLLNVTKGLLDNCEAECTRLRALNKELLEALEECAGDLENEIEHHYKDTKDYPGEKRRYERDIAPVRKARAAIAKAKEET